MSGLSVFLCIILFMMPACAVAGDKTANPRHPSPLDNVDAGVSRCVQPDLIGALQKLSSGLPEDVEQARKVLLDYAKQSETCRARVVSALVSEMDRVDFKLAASAYNLWREGARLLGDLKATESLDLLISHLDLNDGEFSTSMAHQPAVLGVIKMGPVAIPKLRAALLSNSNPKIRLTATLCLTAIGGQPAVDSIRRALRSETDQCVSDFMRVSLSVLAEDAKSRRRASKPTSVSADMNVRGELLSTFVRCS